MDYFPCVLVTFTQICIGPKGLLHGFIRISPSDRLNYLHSQRSRKLIACPGISLCWGMSLARYLCVTVSTVRPLRCWQNVRQTCGPLCLNQAFHQRMHAYVACSIFQLLGTRFHIVLQQMFPLAEWPQDSLFLQYCITRPFVIFCLLSQDVLSLQGLCIISFLLLYSLAKGMLSVLSLLPVAGDAVMVGQNFYKPSGRWAVGEPPGDLQGQQVSTPCSALFSSRYRVPIHFKEVSRFLTYNTHHTSHCYSVKYPAACIPAQLLLMLHKLVPLNPTDQNRPVVNNTAYRRTALPQQDEQITCFS